MKKWELSEAGSLSKDTLLIRGRVGIQTRIQSLYPCNHREDKEAICLFFSPGARDPTQDLMHATTKVQPQLQETISCSLDSWNFLGGLK